MMREPSIQTFSVSTRAARQLLDITESVQSSVTRSGAQDGVCYMFLPHTTAALTLTENWDPDVPDDILHTLGSQTAPPSPMHRHAEGNSAAHIQSSLLGVNLFLIIEKGRLILGPWQGVFLAEFDGPRERRVIVKILAG
jgi:secondary thiamine-phosphate synthase enzyme